ncbi:hypothetical protein D3C81_2202980 [compost metagenome]
MNFVFLTHIVYADNVRVRERSSRLRLAAEAADKLLIVHKLLAQHLDSDVAAQ